MRGPGHASPRPSLSRSARPPVSTSLSTLKLCATHCASPRSSSPSHDPRRLVGGRCCECTRAHHGARCCESTRPPWRPMLRKHGPTMAPAHARSRLRPGVRKWMRCGYRVRSQGLWCTSMSLAAPSMAPPSVAAALGVARDCREPQPPSIWKPPSLGSALWQSSAAAAARAHFLAYKAVTFSMSVSTMEGSARVDVSPRESVSWHAILRSTRRMIFPERVLGSAGVSTT